MLCRARVGVVDRRRGHAHNKSGVRSRTLKTPRVSAEATRTGRWMVLRSCARAPPSHHHAVAGRKDADSCVSTMCVCVLTPRAIRPLTARLACAALPAAYHAVLVAAARAADGMSEGSRYGCVVPGRQSPCAFQLPETPQPAPARLPPLPVLGPCTTSASIYIVSHIYPQCRNFKGGRTSLPGGGVQLRTSICPPLALEICT